MSRITALCAETCYTLTSIESRHVQLQIEGTKRKRRGSQAAWGLDLPDRCGALSFDLSANALLGKNEGRAMGLKEMN